MAAGDGGTFGARDLVADFSLEMTGKDMPALYEARDKIPPGTRINVTYLGNEDMQMRVNAAVAVSECGFVPVPHISARRLGSQVELEEFLDALVSRAGVDSVLVIGGDPPVPEGPYADSLSIVQSGLLPKHGIRAVSVGGYPEGHPDIPDEDLRRSLTQKMESMSRQGLTASVITQFGFDTGPVVAWVADMRERGVSALLRIGVPGPAGIKRLLTYAKRFGVGSSAGIARKYGFSLANLLGTAGPDAFIRDLAAELDPAELDPVEHGRTRLHFYTFGGLARTADWISEFAAENT